MAANSRLLPLPDRLEVQDVKASYRKVCEVCEELPVGRRLEVRSGGGRRRVSLVYCVKCGREYVLELREQLERADLVLAHGRGAIRGKSFPKRRRESVQDAD